VALTGHNEAYYTDYRGKPQEFISAMKWGYLYQGQYYSWQEKPRGTPAYGLGSERFITFLQNHDQVANSLHGLRVDRLCHPALLRALTALLLLGPATPMLFQGQEFAAAAPFLFFCDHHSELARLVREGRAKFLCQFPTICAAMDRLRDPCAESSFTQCKLDFAERERHASVYQLHRDLLRIRHGDAVLSSPYTFDGAVAADKAFVLRYFGGDKGERLLLINLGADLILHAAPEPLLAPPASASWELSWSSEQPEYGGNAMPESLLETKWRLPAQSALFLASQPLSHE
jgi:maltooligosyltrehalose trehalohydrolase